MSAIVVNLQAVPRDAASWCDLARRAEAAGFASLLVPDHPGTCASPFVALAAAASATRTIRLGSYVANAGVWDPLLLASEVATLDVISHGRARLGIGAGHTSAEWEMRGREYPSPSERVAELISVTEATIRLLTGDTVTSTGARLDAPRPVQRVELLVGGNGKQVVEFGSRVADIVSITGLGRTLADGHRHELDWSTAATDERVAWLKASGRSIVIDALVQAFAVTDDVEREIDLRFAGAALPPRDVMAAPYALIGSVPSLAEEMLRHRDRFGFTSFTVREPAFDAAAAVIERLAG